VETPTTFLVVGGTGGVFITLGGFLVCDACNADVERFSGSVVFIAPMLGGSGDVGGVGVSEDKTSVVSDISEDEKSEESVVGVGEKSEDSEVEDFESSVAEESKLFVL